MIKKIFLQFICIIVAYTSLAQLQAQIYENPCKDCSSVDQCNICQNQFWLEADYLYWQIQDSPEILPLVIEQPVVNGLFNVVLGGKKIKNDWHSGARFTLGYWFDSCNSLGAEVNYFFLGKKSNQSNVASDENGSPRLRVPFFNVNTGQPDSTAVATPGLFKGDAFLKISNRMQGAELNIIKAISLENSSNFKVLGGFRYWNFDDSVTFFVDSPLVAFPTVYNNQDKFNTQNNFYGGQIGACFDQCFSCFQFNVKGKVALGAMCQRSIVHGRFKTNEFTGSVQTFAGGYFAQPTNMGNHKKTRFSVIPELDISIGYQIMDCLRVRAGYSALYASGVLRAAKQMNSAINPTQSANIEFTPTPVLVGEPSPQAKLKSSGLWTQGINVGLDFSF